MRKLINQNSIKTHCIHGHKFTAKNTYLRKDGKGRQCWECKRLQRKKDSKYEENLVKKTFNKPIKPIGDGD